MISAWLPAREGDFRSRTGTADDDESAEVD
jgi:hypothetical protein